MKSYPVLISLFIILFTLPSVASAEKKAEFKETVNVRSAPTLSSSVITQVHQDDLRPILEVDGEWIKIELETEEFGWVARRLVTITTDNDSAKTVKPTVSDLQVRAGPGKQFTVLASIDLNTKWRVIKTEKDWIAIDYYGQEGWVASWLVNSTTESEQALSSSSTKEVQANILNVRESQGLESRIISQLPEGSVVEEVKKENDWSFIRYDNGQTGWVDSSFLKETTKSGGPGYATILYQATNLRDGPGLENRVISQARLHEKYQILSKEGQWYKIALPDGTSAYVAEWVVSTAAQLSNKQNLNARKTVVLDAGHGGNDSGAEGITTLEKILTLRTTSTIAEKLKSAGVRVILTRDTDTYISLSERATISERHNADAFVSIHFDSTVDPTANGTTTYYYDQSDMSLASAIHNEIGDDTSLRDRGVRFGNYYVLRNNKQPSVLLELGFLSNPWEEQLVNRIDYQAEITSEVANGILSFLQ
ncbi:N-acetylmuramoyl-L-alanine amidase [Bacillus sp. NTK071]|uniref:N-acetylmuramoyl-L-alanine amidase n=1 Tax=Bacillus sp. NTK071 TaxID=2802175 RepID=UPI001A8CCA31|nr:N-acetylmuramoyl-L-alanine amidase [Bacillus sp. NTK071]MBN8208422.1 N-acetylmuramoyl-L-alanine amidase [Bacillus sp. NTK071]